MGVNARARERSLFTKNSSRRRVRLVSVGARVRLGPHTIMEDTSASLPDEMQKVLDEAKARAEADERMAPILVAAESGDASQLSSLLDQLGLHVDTPGEDGDTALHMACLHGHQAAVEECLKRGASVLACDEDGSTPLHDACAGGYYEIAKQLLDHKAQLDAVDGDGDTPLHLAVNGGHSHVVNLLLERAGDSSKQHAMLGLRNGLEQRPVDLAEDPSLMRQLQIAGGDTEIEEAGSSAKTRKKA